MDVHRCTEISQCKGAEKMKKIGKSILAFLISTAFILIQPISAFAYEYGTLDFDSMVQKEQIGKKTVTSISTENVNRIKNSKSKKVKKKTDKEKLTEILTCLDIDLDERQLEEVHSKVKLSDVGKIETSTGYLVFDEEGTQTEVTEEELMNIDNALPMQKSIADNTITHDIPEKVDGSMRLQMIIVYTPHYHGTGTTPDRYAFIGTCEWLKEPLNVARKTDCIAFKSNDLRWEKLGEDAYSMIVSYHMLTMQDGVPIIDEQCYETFDEKDASVSAINGVFFEYDLPNDRISLKNYTKFTDIGFLISAVGKIDQFSTTDKFKNVSIDLLYKHTRIAFSPSISFSWDGKAVSATIGVTQSSTDIRDFEHYYPWDFKKDYDKFF